jgi:hypothetical protein
MRYVEIEGPAKSVFSSILLEDAEKELAKRRKQEPGALYYLSLY